jgi:hypothetical protein
MVATVPRVTAFLVDHAAGFEERFVWEWPFVTDPDAVTVVATEPIEVRVSIEGADGARLTVTVDERAQVVNVDRD